MKKVTLKDIAKRADVSVATVSYVLNNVENQKISDEIRARIIDIARELKYVPNLTARTLAKRKSGLVGILIIKSFKNDIPWKECYYFNYINRLEKMLSEMGYHVIINSIDISDPKLDIITERELEGVFILDVNREAFYKISPKINVPVIVIDSYIDDPLFHKIVLDFEDAVKRAKELLDGRASFMVMDKFNNYEVNERIKIASCFSEEDIYVMESEDGLVKFLNKHVGQKGIIINEFIGVVALKYVNQVDIAVISICGSEYLLPGEVKKVVFNNDEKAIASIELISKYMSGIYYDDKYTVIKAE